MIFQVFKTSDRGATSDTPPLLGAKKVSKDRTGRRGAVFRNSWWEIEVETLEQLLGLCQKTAENRAKIDSRFEVVLQPGGYPYDQDQPDFALEIVDEHRD